MVNLNNVYNYYSTQLTPPKANQRSNSHKKDDLKTVYQNIVKQNQHSPLYKFTFSDHIQAYAIGIKEAAMALDADSESLSGQSDNGFAEMKAVSSNENVVYANLRDNAAEELPDDLAIQVKALAQGQTNVGKYLPSGESSFAPGNYSFGIAVGNNEYTFHLNIHDGDTNIEIQRNLASAINDNDIGVRASVRSNRMDGTSAMVLRSDDVGKPENGDLIFRFDESYLENDITADLGVHQVEQAPSNAEFYINDTFHTSISNRISLNHTMDIDFLSVSEEPVHVGYVPDEEKLSDKISDFINSYNALVDLSKNEKEQNGATRLYHDITGVARRHSEELKSAGINIDENGHLVRADDDDVFSSSRIQALFNDKISDFRKDLNKATGKMTLNPLDYVDKVVVTYPDTVGNTYPNPYNPSKYSGLLFNDYR